MGFKHGSKEAWNRSNLEKFESRATVHRYYPTSETAEIFADLLLSLKAQGNPIPVHDIWIGAIAVETGSVVVTYDKHFLKMQQLRIWEALK